jgi:predicted nucleotidyltransferase
MNLPHETVKKLKEYFHSRPDICFAFLFGSYGEGKASNLSDIDIAIYFYPKGKSVEWEEIDYWNNSMLDLWLEIEDMVGIDVDLLILNLVNPLVASTAIRGIPLIIKNTAIFFKFSSIIDDEAENKRYDLLNP